MARTLHLQKSELENINYLWVGAYRLRVDVSDPADTGADPNVFLYQRGEENPRTGLTDDYWIGITSPVDLAEYPIGEPNGRTTYPFFRLDYVEVDLRSSEMAQKAWLLIIEEIGNLLKALDRLENLVPTEGVYVGAALPSDSGDSSSSESQSDSASESISE